MSKVLKSRTITTYEYLEAHWLTGLLSNVEADGNDLVLAKDNGDYLSSGYRISPPLSANDITKVASSLAEWSATTPAGTAVKLYFAAKETEPIVAEDVGTGDGAETVFYLDNFPCIVADDLIVKVDGVATTDYTLDWDNRKITFDAAPANTKPITADYTAVTWPEAGDWLEGTHGEEIPEIFYIP